MKNNITLGLSVSLFVFIGFPIIFLFISLFTGQWNYLIYSIFPSFFAGLTGLIATIKERKSI